MRGAGPVLVRVFINSVTPFSDRFFCRVPDALGGLLSEIGLQEKLVALRTLPPNCRSTSVSGSTEELWGSGEAMSDTILCITDVRSISEVVSRVRDGFETQCTLPCRYRITQLKNLRRMFEEKQNDICEALWEDLRKAQQECLMSELNPISADLSLAIDSVEKWMAPEHVGKDLLNSFNTAFIQSEPYGVVLIMSPWNYPVLLALQPLVGAIAAGNACVLKLSEVAVATSNVLAKLIPQYLDTKCYAVVTGEVDVAKEVLKQRFDYIFYTGSAVVGKSIMVQAAQHLTPLTLELGGKSPCIVADDANIEVAAQRIMWGKCLNAGQSCIAPDYVICTSAVQGRLVEACKGAVIRFFGQDPKCSPDYGRIINARHFRRILSMLDPVREKVAYGGIHDEQDRYIAPTLITDVTADDGIMSEEIFGPLLPFVVVESGDKAIEFIRKRDKALVVYVFTESKRFLRDVVLRTSAGAVTHNDTMLHYSVSTLPFGGVGKSGFGCYHGKFSFDTLSHRKPVLSTVTSRIIEGANNIRYPPFCAGKESDMQKLQLHGRGPSRFFKLLHLVTMSATGHTPHNADPVAAGQRDGEDPVAAGQRDGEDPVAADQRDGEDPVAAGQRDGEDPVAAGQRDGEDPVAADQRDGEDPVAADQRDGEDPVAAGQRDGEDPVAAGQRDGEDPVAADQRDGEDPVAADQRDGEDPVAAGQRDGEDPVATGQRDGEDLVADDQRDSEADSGNTTQQN